MATRRSVPLAAVAVTLLASAGASAATAGGERSSSLHGPRGCQADELALRIATNGAGGGLTPRVAVYNRGSRSCRLDATLTFAIQDRRGRALAIAGNPVRLRLRADRLAHGRAAWAAWWWTNWCGRARPPFVYRAHIGTSSATFVERAAPRCEGGGVSGSTISLLTVCPQPENAGLLAPRSRAGARLICRG